MTWEDLVSSPALSPSFPFVMWTADFHHRWIQTGQYSPLFLFCPAALESHDQLEEQVGAARCQIDRLLKTIDAFPTCFNQVLLQGSLAYCRRALNRYASASTELLQAIFKYVSLVEPTVISFADEVPPGWPKLDFTLYADRFENIQRLASATGVLPLLEDLTVEDFQEG